MPKIAIPFISALFPLCMYAQHRGEKNVLFIFIDDLRPALGCYGDSLAITPHIDSLASKSFLFANAYCQQAVSGPSRASILTGLRPDQIGVTDLNTHFREKFPKITTLPQLFKNNGYESIGLGKIFHGSLRTQDTISWSKLPLYNLSIKKEEYTLPQNRHGKKATAIEIADEPESAFRDGKVTKEALKTLDELSKSRHPFFLAIGYIKPHLPFSMPKRYWDLFNNHTFTSLSKKNEEKPIKSPDIAFHNWEELRGYTDIPQSGSLSADKKEELRKGYYACVSFIDEQVGILLNKLEETDLAKNTIIILVGDNGFHLNEQNLWGKATNFELDCAVPLLIYDPDTDRYLHKINKIVELVDIYPTLTDLCGLIPPHTLSGKSLSPLMKGQNIGKDYAFSQFPRPYSAINSSLKQTHMGYTIRTQDWRYTLWYDKKNNQVTDKELYNMKEKKTETENVSGQKRYAKIENELQQLIEQYKKQH